MHPLPQVAQASRCPTPRVLEKTALSLGLNDTHSLPRARRGRLVLAQNAAPEGRDVLSTEGVEGVGQTGQVEE